MPTGKHKEPTSVKIVLDYLREVDNLVTVSAISKATGVTTHLLDGESCSHGHAAAGGLGAGSGD